MKKANLHKVSQVQIKNIDLLGKLSYIFLINIHKE
jgi:hypothetical protein